MPVPFSFGAATTAIPLSQLDSNFNTPITLGNTAIQLGNTVTTLNNMTLANVTISSGNVTITNVTVTTANATTVNTTTLIATTANVTTGNVTNLISGNVTLTGGSITGTTISGSTGSFTTLTTSSTVTLNGGTANGVAYLDGSKVLTTGSALTFDGTALAPDGTGRTLGTTALRWGTVYATAFADGTDQLVGSSGAQARFGYGPSWTSQAFAIGGSEQMRLTSTGLGIGTSSPQARLHINSGAGSTQFRMGPNSTSSDRALINYNSTTNRFTIDMSGNDAVVVDGSGNLGLGVTPSAWSTSLKALQIQTTSVSANNGAWSALGYNNFYDSVGYKYQLTAAASLYRQEGAAHIWYQAPSGTAGNAITFTQALTLDASGNLYLGATSGARGGSTTRQLVKLGTSQSYLEIQSASTSSTADAILFSDGSTGNYGQVGYDHSADALNFFTASTERARIDSGGNLGVGTTSPAGKIHGNGEIYWGDGASSYAGFLSYATNEAQIHAKNSGTYALTFHTLGTERARITSGGYFKASDDGTYVGVADATHEFRQTANNNALVVSATNASYTSTVFRGIVSRAASTAFDFEYHTANAVLQWQVRGDGNAYNVNGTYGTISDAKMKTDIVDAGSQWSDIKALRFRKFKMKDDPSGLVQLGVVAQEVEQTSPGLVDEHTDRDAEGNDLGTTTKSVKTSVLLMKAAVALQEAMARIEKLEAEVATLKGA